MRTLYDPAVGRQTKRATAKVRGFYTAQEAAEKLGVDVGTLKYRRDHADAKTLWQMLGTAEEDETYKLLSESHQILNGKHYYEQKAFDKFVKKYLARPEVVRARKAKTTWAGVKETDPILTVPIKTAQDVDNLAAVLHKLLSFNLNSFSNLSIILVSDRR